MPHSTTLISTVVLSLVVAFCGGFLARKLRMPPLVGYVLAGVAVGPYTPGLVGDENLASQLAEIGVILLMFGVGLHFSIKDLLAVRRIAVPGALGQIVVATVIGVTMAHFWGWSLGAGMVLGLALSVASTVVVLRALEERNALDSVNGRIAVGWLVVEDLVMVLALVLLPALAAPLSGSPDELAAAASDSSLWLNLAVTLGKVMVFVALVVVVGTRIVPWLLGQVARTGSRELFVLAVLVVALGIAFTSAELFGVSFAIGAFFAGVVLSESDFSHQAAADSLPLKDAFAVLFFVSIGMLFDPGVLARDPFAVLAVVFAIVFGKSIAAFAIVLVGGYPVTTALTVSASLAQIGEFSFILAGLGAGLGLLPPEARDLIVAGALLSITLNPLVFATIDPVAAWLRARPGLIRRLERSSSPLASLPAGSEPGGLRNHAVIVGYGQVGSIIGDVLTRERLPFVVIEDDRRRVEKLRRSNVLAVYGDAAAAGVLDAAGIEHARLLIVATPEGLKTRRIIDLAREANPRIDTAIRTQSVGEVAHLERQGVGLAILGEWELALGLASYSLKSLGVSHDQAASIVQHARTAGEGGAYARRLDGGLPRPAPELRRSGSDRSDDRLMR